LSALDHPTPGADAVAGATAPNGRPGGSVAQPSGHPSRPMLEIVDLSVEFRTGGEPARAVRRLSLSLNAGETLSLVGESGSGKTASALSILGLLPRPAGRITGGSIRFEGRELVGLSASEFRTIRGAKIAMILQDPLSSLNPVLTIGWQIVEQIREHTKCDAKEARVRAGELLRQVGIPDPERRLASYPHELSGGMRQRAMIAMALSCRPKLLIADEPTTALDVTVQAQILELLDSLRRELSMAVVLVTHDLGIVARLADRVAVMYAGMIVEAGPTEQVLGHPAHPYTLGLLASLPRLDRPRVEALTSIEGQPPNPAMLPPGCPFAPRCRYVGDRCRQEPPKLEQLAPQWHAACWFPPSRGR